MKNFHENVYFQVFKNMYFKAFKNCMLRHLEIVLLGIQGAEELEKDHAGPQQNKHNPTVCLQGAIMVMITVVIKSIEFTQY